MAAKTTQLERLEQGLLIDEHALDEALLEQPQLFYECAKALAERISVRDARKQDLANTEAEIDMEIRKKAERAEEKITEKAIDSKKRLDPDVVRRTDDLAETSLEVAKFSALKEAYLQRSYALKDLVALHLASYYSDASAGSSTTTYAANAARAAMARERRDRE